MAETSVERTGPIRGHSERSIGVYGGLRARAARRRLETEAVDDSQETILIRHHIRHTEFNITGTIMSDTINDVATATDREIVITRVFDAPRELVYRVWTDPEHVTEWWGPDGFRTTTHEFDLRPGGVWSHTMHAPDGTDYPNRILFQEVVEPERLVYSHGDGGTMPDFHVTVTFETQPVNRTKVTMRSVFVSRQERDRVSAEFGAVEGGVQHLGRLGEYLMEQTGTPTRSMTLALPTEREIMLTRAFDAPRELVFEAMSDPDHIPKWWGPRYLTTTVDKLDARPGGRWRFIQHDAQGNEYAFNGEYREIVPPERIVLTFEFEGMPGHVVLQTMTLQEVDGKTVLTARSLFDNAEDRNGMLQSGMAEGAADTYDRLEELLEELSGPNAPARDERAIEITRIFEAPRELVWRAWTEPEHMKMWWGPKSFTAPHVEIDLRVGGRYLNCMRSAEGQDYWSTGTYREIVPNERLVLTDSFADPEGNVVPATYYGMDGDFPLEMLVSVTFEDHDRGTKMTLRHEGLPAGEHGEMASLGWNESFDKLEASVKGQTEPAP